MVMALDRIGTMNDLRESLPLPKGIGRPATQALALAGYDQLKQLAGASESALLNLHGVGPTAIRILHRELLDNGLEAMKP